MTTDEEVLDRRVRVPSDSGLPEVKRLGDLTKEDVRRIADRHKELAEALTTREGDSDD